MAFPVETAAGYVAVVTSLADKHAFFVPGMETYFSTFPVVVYQSPKQLLEQLERSATPHLPHLIVMDIAHSTDLSLHILRELKARERFRSIPVLMHRTSNVTSRTILSPASPERPGVKPALMGKNKYRFSFRLQATPLTI